MSDLPRRRLLALGGTALTGAIAGCSSSANEDDPNGNDDSETDGTGDEDDTEPGDGDENGDETGTDDADSTALGDIAVENLSGNDHTVNIILEFDGEIEHWSTHELSAGDGATLDRDWDDDAGEFRVILRLDDGDPVQDTATSWNEPDCLNLLVTINRNGELTTHADTNSGPCGDGDADFDEGDE
ncbi:uncharacterized protein Nmag_1742 [Natrialba magadii ATCC 43099]|uniref:Uncharacterized protein n=1 Tax=Natrialba magadii (strain ATCC 43099 / DSM 3394 / CCM 3739 / CIP 104546 / IAM 13178 / JCM 8861 / NBRC 102185 / NCIMB 2190 / MS3) TaxID=547559 RepID=D3SUQ8_NATMM|nr:hypothetical protein [Natrialba magadii]ADD05316.1 uncharacterized protein Nmag_1742 [Natrialba magadii ATCC 43099]ELY29135.1 hypothetical protein C500_11635 [Natrialba magadii ATCC 43099]